MLTRKSKTVLQLIDSLYRGGAQKVVLDIVRALPEYNHIVCYWADDRGLEESFSNEGVLLVKLPFRGMYTIPQTIFFLYKLIRIRKVDYIHAHMFTPNLLARTLKSKHITTISTYHGECFEARSFRGFMMRLLERCLLFRTDIAIAVSGYIKGYLHNTLRTRKQIRVIHNYGQVSSEDLSYKPKSYGNPVNVVATSNNQVYKNYPLLLNAFQRLRGKPITLDIFGSGMEPLIEWATAHELGNVKFKGVSKNVSEMLLNYDVYIATSDSGEGFSLSMLEAMNAGLPVVCSSIPQFIEAVGDAGIIFSNRNLDELVSVLEDIVLNPGQLTKVALLSKQRSAQFSQANFEKKIRQVYGL